MDAVFFLANLEASLPLLHYTIYTLLLNSSI